MSMNDHIEFSSCYMDRECEPEDGSASMRELTAMLYDGVSTSQKHDQSSTRVGSRRWRSSELLRGSGYLGKKPCSYS